MALTLVDAVMLTMQEATPVQAPPHPANTEPESCVADRLTMVPTGKSYVQVAPQSMPAGVDVTVPLPAPSLVTIS